MFDIQKRVEENPLLGIQIVRGTDEVCCACPFLKENKCSKKPGINYWVRVQDNKVLKALEIKANSSFTAKDIFNLSIEKINNKELKRICEGCEFSQYCLKNGLNKSFTKKIK